MVENVEFEKLIEESQENFIKSKDILKGYFKTLYENAGMEWTENNDEDIEFIVNSIFLNSINQSGKILIETHNK